MSCKMEPSKIQIPIVSAYVREEKWVKPLQSTEELEIKKSCVLSIHDAIKPLYTLSRLLSVWPYRYGPNNTLTALTNKDKAIAATFTLVMAIYLSWSMYARNATVSLLQPTVTAIIDGIFNVFLHLLAGHSIAVANSSRGALTQNFYTKLNGIAKSSPLFHDCIFDDIRKKLLGQMMLTFAGGLLIGVAQVWLGLKVNYVLVVIYLSTFVAEELLFLIFLQVLCKVEILTKYFQVLNYRLGASVAPSDKASMVGKHQSKAEYVQSLCKIHRQLCGLIEDINRAHGWQIVLLSCTIISLSINSLYFGVINGLETGSPPSREATKIELAFSCQAIFNVLFHSGLLFTLAVKCSIARGEALKTGTLANEMLIDSCPNDSSEAQRTYKEQLQFLIQHIMFENPQFSAAGIFPVDSTIISVMTGAVTTYFIVILQFRQPLSVGK